MKEKELPSPNCPDVEKAVLSAILRDAKGAFDAIFDVFPLVQDEVNSFYTPLHRLIYKTMLKMYENDEPINIQTVYQHLKGQVSKVCLAEIEIATINNDNLPKWNDLLLKFYSLRKLIKVCSDFIQKCKQINPDANPQTFIDHFQNELYRNGIF